MHCQVKTLKQGKKIKKKKKNPATNHLGRAR